MTFQLSLASCGIALFLMGTVLVMIDRLRSGLDGCPRIEARPPPVPRPCTEAR